MPTVSVGNLLHAQVGLGRMPCVSALRVVTSWNSAGLMRYVPAVRKPSWRPALAAAAQERLRVLEVVARDLAAEHALGRDRRAVGGDDQRDLARRHHDHRHLDDAVLPAERHEVPAGRQQARLVARLAVERDQAPGGQRGTVLLDHQARLVLADDPGAGHHDGEQQRGRADGDRWRVIGEERHEIGECHGRAPPGAVPVQCIGSAMRAAARNRGRAAPGGQRVMNIITTTVID